MEKNYPLVSICMPAYNAGKFITAAVMSVVHQSYLNWELIIIDDGSTDDTALLLSCINDPRIRLYPQKNKGQCAAANRAFYLSKGQLIKFMDADDLLSPQFIEAQVKRIGHTPACIASAAWGRFYNDLSDFKLDTNIVRLNTKPIEWLVASMYDKQPMMQCALWLIPRAVLNRSGLWNETLSLINDFEFFIRVLLQAEEIRFCENAILYYRSGLPNSLSAQKTRKAAESAYRSIQMGTTQLIQYENSPRVKKIAADSFQTFVYGFYPQHRDLTDLAQKRTDELGGSHIGFPAGGLTKILKTLIGWKLVKKIKTYL
uniref:glycosyltransferase family 2 protein n=1 Tax=Pedobacter schmidteae TaxID=2201271 RepID=UPI000EB1E82D|nr:glycosyltransferase family 2 protein [Pedobacter schmidteae]